MLRIESISDLDGVRLYFLTATGGDIVVGNSFRAFRNGTEVGKATTSGVLVDGKLLDQARRGQSCELLLRGAKFEVGDLLQAEDQ